MRYVRIDPEDDLELEPEGDLPTGDVPEGASAAALLGGVFLLAADLVAQSLLYPVLLPIGIICAFTGTPVFLFLLFRGAARHAGRV